MDTGLIDTCANRIAKALSIRGMKQSELCEKTRIPKSAISQYISGAFLPKQDRIFLMAKALNVEPIWLMGYDVPMGNNEEIVTMSIGSNILYRRKSLGLTQEELAKKMGYKSKSTINKIELGINDIPQSKIAKFAEVLDTTPTQLMGWDEIPTSRETLNDGEKKLLNAFRQVPHDMQNIALDMLMVFLGNHK